jgi:hypothetical protein
MMDELEKQLTIYSRRLQRQQKLIRNENEELAKVMSAAVIARVSEDTKFYYEQLVKAKNERKNS